MTIITVLGCEKTKPIQNQTKPILFSPQILWGLKNLLEKTSLSWAESNGANISEKQKEKGENVSKYGGIF